MSKKKNKQLDPNIMNAPEEASSADLVEETAEEVEEVVEGDEVTSSEETKEEVVDKEPIVETPVEAEPEVIEQVETPEVITEEKEAEAIEEEMVEVEAPVAEAEVVNANDTVISKEVLEKAVEDSTYTFLLVIEGNGKDLNDIVTKINANRRAKDLKVMVDEEMERVVVFRTGDQKVATRRQKELVGWGIKTKMIILK